MIYEEFEVITLEPVRYEQAEISVLDKTDIKPRRHIKKVYNGGVIDMLIKQCLICFFVLMIFTAVNFVGFNAFMDNLKQVIENRSLSEYFLNANFI